ncbi:hypothetical protein ACHAWC_003628 [Mediolabrus comicus]
MAAAARYSNSRNNSQLHHEVVSHYYEPLKKAINSKISEEVAHKNNNSSFTAYRPRLLYSTLFFWNTITVGKFIAPFLQDVSPILFTDSVVGMTLATQYSIVAIFAGWGGRLGDLYESNNRKSNNNCCWGLGRIKVLAFSVFLGSCAILGHALPSLYTRYYHNNMHTMQPVTELAWHVMMRCIYALSLAIMAPCMDGLALAHLDCIDNASQSDFGSERMFGAAFWGVGSLCAGIGIDRYGFVFLYVMTIVTAVASYVSMWLYLYGIKCDTTGSFVVMGTSSSSSSSLQSKEVLENANNDRNNCLESNNLLEEDNHNSSSLNNNDDELVENEEETTSSYTSTQLFNLICQTGYGRALLFFVFSLAVGISIVDNLAFIFFDSLGSSNTINGLTVVFTVLFEVPIFYLAPRFLQRYGPGKLLMAAGIAYVVRVIGYTLTSHMSVILLLDTLHGISYAGGKAGSVEYIQQMVPKGYEATGQGLLIFVNYLGIVAGLSAGGHIQETLGPRVMFDAMALVVGFGCVVLFLAEICLDPPTGDSKDDEEENGLDESTNLVKSDSACSGSSYADRAAENFMKKNLKYDSLNKYVKDW